MRPDTRKLLDRLKERYSLRQLSNQELLWCRRVARKIRKAHLRYMRACEVLNGSKSVIKIGEGGGEHRNSVEDAHVTKATWEEFEKKLSEHERELLEDIVEGRDHFIRKEKGLLKNIDRKGRRMGLW